MDVAVAWVGAYLGMAVLCYGVLLAASNGDEDAVRVLVRHATRLAHLDDDARERRARRVLVGTRLAAAGLMAGVLTAVAALAWSFS